MATTTNTTTTKKKTDAFAFNTITIITSALCIAAIVVAILFWQKSKKYKTQLSTEKSNSEIIKGEMQKLQTRVTTLTDDNAVLDNELGDAEDKNKAKDKYIVRLNKENRTLGTIKKDIAGLKDINLSLEASTKKIKAIQSKVNKTISDRQAQIRKEK